MESANSAEISAAIEPSRSRRSGEPRSLVVDGNDDAESLGGHDGVFAKITAEEMAKLMIRGQPDRDEAAPQPAADLYTGIVFSRKARRIKITPLQPMNRAYRRVRLPFASRKVMRIWNRNTTDALTIIARASTQAGSRLQPAGCRQRHDIVNRRANGGAAGKDRKAFQHYLNLLGSNDYVTETSCLDVARLAMRFF